MLARGEVGMSADERSGQVSTKAKRGEAMSGLPLVGKRAIVGGSSQGIGRACADALAELGADVTLLARDAEALKTVRDALPTPAKQTHGFLVADFHTPELARDTVAQHIDALGPHHILINNTGGPPGGPIAEATAEEFLRAYHMHLVCNHLLAQTVLPGMRAEGFGRIVNIISTSVKEPIPGLGVSNTTRGAVASWAKTWSREVAPFGVTVNNVLPGYTSTARLQAIIRTRAEKAGVPESEIEAALLAEVPAGRFAQPAEIAALVAFLATPAAGYVNGTSIPVDGARSRSF